MLPDEYYPNHRIHLINMIKEFNIKKIAEVGVDEGGFAGTLLYEKVVVDEFWMIDPWKEYDGKGAGSLSRHTQGAWDRKYQGIIKRLVEKKPLGINFQAYRMTSVEGSKQFADGSLDMVFIDANHDYENTLMDIDAWLPKVKKGGILSGDDYASGFVGVRKAVDERFPNVKLLHRNRIWYIQV